MFFTVFWCFDAFLCGIICLFLRFGPYVDVYVQGRDRMSGGDAKFEVFYPKKGVFLSLWKAVKFVIRGVILPRAICCLDCCVPSFGSTATLSFTYVFIYICFGSEWCDQKYYFVDFCLPKAKTTEKSSYLSFCVVLYVTTSYRSNVWCFS